LLAEGGAPEIPFLPSLLEEALVLLSSSRQEEGHLRQVRQALWSRFFHWEVVVVSEGKRLHNAGGFVSGVLRHSTKNKIDFYFLLSLVNFHKTLSGQKNQILIPDWTYFHCSGAQSDTGNRKALKK